MRDAIVIGAGMTGLTCGYQLSRLGLDVLILEGGSRPGGVIHTEHRDGYMVEHGPNSLMPTAECASLIGDLGLQDQLVTAPRKAPRFIYLDGRLRKAPFGAISIRGLARAAAEPLIRSRSVADETAADFFSRRLGRETHDRLVAPFITGIYGGNSRNLSVAAAFPRLVSMESRHGSLLWGMLKSPRRNGPRPRLSSFRDGMGVLPRRLARDLNVVYDAAGIQVSPQLEVRWDSGVEAARAVIVTVPAYRVASILSTVTAETRRQLEAIPYAPMVVAAAAYPNSAFPEAIHGFGFLVPRTEKLHLLGALFSSFLFPKRAPDGFTLLTAFVGGAHEPEVVEWSDSRVWETLDREFRTTLKANTPPSPVGLIRHARAIPQYDLGHERRVAAVREEVARTPGLFVAGNYLDGISVPACMEAGARVAGEAAAFIRSTT